MPQSQKRVLGQLVLTTLQEAHPYFFHVLPQPQILCITTSVLGILKVLHIARERKFQASVALLLPGELSSPAPYKDKASKFEPLFSSTCRTPV